MKRGMRAMVFPLLGAMLAAIAVAGSAPVRAQDSETGLSATLSGPAINGVTPNGFAEFEERHSVGTFKAQVRNVNLPDGTEIVISVSNPLPAGGGVFSGLTLSGGQARIQLPAPGLSLLPGDQVLVQSVDGTITYLSGVLQ